MIYRGTANPNATNSELDAKILLNISLLKKNIGKVKFLMNILMSILRNMGMNIHHVRSSMVN